MMNRPKAMNSFNQDFVDDFMAALQEVERDKTIRVVVLTGNGKAFSAGGFIPYSWAEKSCGS